MTSNGTELTGALKARHVERSVRPQLRNKVMDIQRLRNLITGRLHTGMGHVYQDVGACKVEIRKH